MCESKVEKGLSYETKCTSCREAETSEPHVCEVRTAQKKPARVCRKEFAMETQKKEKILLGLACFFAGMTTGFLLAPIKKGVSVSCGNNNTISKEKS